MLHHLQVPASSCDKDPRPRYSAQKATNPELLSATVSKGEHNGLWLGGNLPRFFITNRSYRADIESEGKVGLKVLIKYLMPVYL